MTINEQLNCRANSDQLKVQKNFISINCQIQAIKDTVINCHQSKMDIRFSPI